MMVKSEYMGPLTQALYRDYEALLRVARAAKEMVAIHHVEKGVRMSPVTVQILEALKEVENLL